MAPEVVGRKLRFLRGMLEKLRPFAGASLEQARARQLELERILELLVTASADLLQHLLVERDVVASTYRETFTRAGEAGLIPPDLAGRLEKAAGMRNLLVHLYEEIDLQTLHHSVEPALNDFAALIAAVEAQLPPVAD